MKEVKYNFPDTSRHVYDIDAFEILDILKDNNLSQNESSQKYFVDLENIELLEKSLVESFREDDYDLSEHQKHRNFVIPSNYNIYNIFLGYKLLTMDAYKIEPLLSFQSVLFLGNAEASKDNFIGLIEFLVYRFVKARVLPFEEKRLEKIVNWLERNRTFLVDKAYNEIVEPLLTDSKTEVVDISKASEIISENEVAKKPINRRDLNVNVRIVYMDAQFAPVLCEKLSFYFEGYGKQLRELIVKNVCKDKIVFSGQANQLAELFKRLRYNSIIQVSNLKVLAQWIVDNFSNYDENGLVISLDLYTIYQVLKRTSREPPKGKRILLELAPFIVSDQRKIDKSN